MRDWLKSYKNQLFKIIKLKGSVVDRIYMVANHGNIPIYHITCIENLPAILQAGGLLSDAKIGKNTPKTIGYSNIKQRRLTEIKVDSCGNKFVGEFVPFYYCPRSPMLLTINSGNTGLPRGCQVDIVHLVSNVGIGIGLGKDWAISDGNAGSYAANFDSNLTRLDSLDWDAIGARQWGGRQHQKMAEFLVYEFFPWAGISSIGCINAAAKQKVAAALAAHGQTTPVNVTPNWYY